MRFKMSRNKISRLYQLFLPALALIITITIIRHPDDAFDAAVEGLDVWFNIVLPALLPFFIGSQILMGLGVVHFMGVLLEPFMRPLFNVPGAGSFVMAMGLASGYPIGAMLTGKLTEQGLCNTWEAERLISFTNTADPLFMVGAVAVGMFKDARLGTILALAHYISALLVGILMRFYAIDRKTIPLQKSKKKKTILFRGVSELIKARKEDGRPFGKLIGDCITDSINSMLLVLGFIIVFSVIIRIVHVTGFVAKICPFIDKILGFLGINKSLSPAIVSGFFEITLGTQIASKVDASLMEQMVVTSSIIAWSGLSVHFQVISMVSNTNIKIYPYLIARVLHSIFAGIVTYLLMTLPITRFDSFVVPVFSHSPKATSESWISIFMTSTKVFLILFIVVLFISILVHLLKGFEIISFKVVKK